MNNEPYKASEIYELITLCKPCVLLVNGREHNVIIEKIGNHYIHGHVSQNKVVMLIDRPGRGGSVVKVVSSNDESAAVGPGDELIHSEPCVVSTKYKITIAIESVDIFEDPWRPFIPPSVFGEEGVANCEELCNAIPALKAYHVPGKGFVSSPEAWNRDALLSETNKDGD